MGIHSIEKNLKGEFITVEGHKPDYKQYKSKQYYLDNAQSIGEDTYEFCQMVIEQQPHSYTRVISGILHLENKPLIWPAEEPTPIRHSLT